jgi:hypothetical protein
VGGGGEGSSARIGPRVRLALAPALAMAASESWSPKNSLVGRSGGDDKGSVGDDLHDGGCGHGVAAWR